MGHWRVQHQHKAGGSENLQYGVVLCRMEHRTLDSGEKVTNVKESNIVYIVN